MKRSYSVQSCIFTPQWHSLPCPSASCCYPASARFQTKEAGFFYLFIYFYFYFYFGCLFSLLRLLILHTTMAPWLVGIQQRRRAHSHSAHHQHVLASHLVPVVQSTKPKGGGGEKEKARGQWDSLVVQGRARECGWASVIDSAMLCCGMSSRAGRFRSCILTRTCFFLLSRFIISLLFFLFPSFLFATRPSKPSVAPQTLARPHTRFWARGTEFALHHPSIREFPPFCIKEKNSIQLLDLSGKPLFFSFF